MYCSISSNVTFIDVAIKNLKNNKILNGKTYFNELKYNYFFFQNDKCWWHFECAQEFHFLETT